MFADKSKNSECLSLSMEEQIQLKIIVNLINEAKNAGRNFCTWYKLNENVVKRLKQSGYKVKKQNGISLEQFIITFPQA